MTALAVTTLSSCGSVNGNDGCDDQISASLKRTMFWGGVSPDHWEANRGDEIGDILRPLWHAEDSIFVHTARIDHGTDIVGIFDVAIDPATRSFRGFRAYAFANVIRDYDYDPITRDFALTFSHAPDDIQTSYARAVGDSLVIGESIKDVTWFPLSARFSEAGNGLYIYAHDPSTLVNGFYFVSRQNPAEDSLVHAVELTVPDARGFDVAAGMLCFGQTDLTGSVHTTVFVIQLGALGGPRAVATFEGAFVSASVRPEGTCAILSLDDLVSGNVVGLLDLTTGGFTKLNVQTRPCTHPVADFASWSPNAGSFAFSAGAFNSEGAIFPRELWIKTSVTCR